VPKLNSPIRRQFDSPYDVRNTDLSRPMIPQNGGGNGSGGDGFRNRIITNTTPFTLAAGQSTRALPRNDRRVGLQIQNLDASAALRYSFGNDLLGSGLQILANNSVLYDFSTPPDELYLFCATANIYVVVMDMTRGF
jgi:hypothetical protein